MSCLGERLTALVDGELGHDERDRALAHLARCERCRSEADALRRLKGRLRGLADLPASDGADDLPSGDFLSRLRGMAEPAGGLGDQDSGDGEPPTGMPTPSLPLTRPLRPGVRAGHPGSGRIPSRPRDNRPAARAGGRSGAGHAAAVGLARRPPRRRYLAVGAATLFLGLGTASYAVGGRQEAPAVTPAFDRFAVEHALTSGDAPLTDTLTDQTTVQVSPEP
ncbi:zf-HC2 domain-containing protein [Actinomadura barringtoniae]|uniref:Zf-HC2 domain-containing protein n=1 Tax=Actinomadura barringtoniae TaxID=1427535 RepID=A0A939PMM9_9ACTN|nr:zf-HC2 domain-containing protein [Actinomadura barringtoniae]MBO2455090.1 zf-HC2 domain-containing protein [Actinomadura barringtoniae]